MNKIICLLFLIASSHLFSNITIKYKNLDKTEVKLKVMIDGEVKEVIFKAGKKGSVTIKGKETQCLFYTSCEERMLKDGDEIEIVNGCIRK